MQHSAQIASCNVTSKSDVAEASLCAPYTNSTMAKQRSLNASYSKVGVRARQYSLATVIQTSCWSFGSFKKHSRIRKVWHVSWVLTPALDGRSLCWSTLQALLKSKHHCMSLKLTELDSAATELYVHSLIRLRLINRSTVHDGCGLKCMSKLSSSRPRSRKNTTSRWQFLLDSAVDVVFAQCQLRKLFGDA